MNWSEVGETLKEYAPLVGMALSSPAGAGVAVAKVVSSILGTKSEPEEVMRFIQDNPEKAAERLQYETANNLEFQKMCLARVQEDNRHDEAKTSLIIQDKMSARNYKLTAVEEQILKVYSYSILLILLGCLVAFIFENGRINEAELSIISAIVGWTLKSASAIIEKIVGTAFQSKNE